MRIGIRRSVVVACLAGIAVLGFLIFGTGSDSSDPETLVATGEVATNDEAPKPKLETSPAVSPPEEQTDEAGTGAKQAGDENQIVAPDSVATTVEPGSTTSTDPTSVASTTPSRATSTRPEATTSTTPSRATSTRPGATTSTTPSRATSTRPGATTSTTPSRATSTRPEATTSTTSGSTAPATTPRSTTPASTTPAAPTETDTPVSSGLNQWDESATWIDFNSTLGLAWSADGGDWLDASNNQGGSNAFSTVAIVDDNAPGLVEMNVLSAIQQTDEADFFLQMTGGDDYQFHSREGSGSGPELVLNGSLVVSAAADTTLNQSTRLPLGNEPTLATGGDGILIRFNLPANVNVTSATLQLNSTGTEFGNQTLRLFVPNPQLRTTQRPSWLSADSAEIASFNGNDVLSGDSPATASNGIATAQLSSPNLTWFDSNITIPNQTQACATVYQKIGADFRPGGVSGKLPGFANTGIPLPSDDVVNGVTYPDSAWGGRSPDGVHWSARTGFYGWNDTHLDIGTYMYAIDPHTSYGWSESLGSPLPKGEWTAYVQCVKLNTVSGSKGNNDGKLYYEIAGVGGVYSREDIRWRDTDAPESEIREFWVDYYCGGPDCGDIANRGTVSFGGAVVTRGMPNMSAVNAEVARLNRDHP